MDDRTLRELVAPYINIQILCIQYPNLDVQCKIKFGLIHFFSKFHDLASEGSQAPQGISYRLHHHHKTVWSSRGIYQVEGIPILLTRDNEGLVILPSTWINH